MVADHDPGGDVDDSRAMLEALFAAMSVGLVVHSPDGAIRRANAAAERILGLTLDQMRGRTSIHPDWRALREDFSEFPGEEHPAMVVIRTGHPVRDVVMGVFNPKQRSHCWILVDAAPIERADGRWAMSTFTDITALRAVESSHVSLLRALDEHAIVSMTDTAGTITYANDAFCRVSGYTRDELVGMNHRILRSGQHDAALYADLWSTISHGGIWRGEICNMRKDGTLYWVLATISALHGPSGSIDGYIAIRTDITDQKTAEESAAWQARVDPLTGCANRRGFDEYVARLWSEAEGRPTALVMLDVDHFKSYNDILGHQAGDRVLTELAGILVDCVPEGTGLVARWGGEEFAVVLPGFDAEAATAAAATMLARVRAAAIPRPEPDSRRPVTVSAGVAVTVPGRRTSSHELAATADRRLYLAKQTGRDRVVGPTDEAGLGEAPAT